MLCHDVFVNICYRCVYICKVRTMNICHVMFMLTVCWAMNIYVRLTCYMYYRVPFYTRTTFRQKLVQFNILILFLKMCISSTGRLGDRSLVVVLLSILLTMITSWLIMIQLIQLIFIMIITIMMLIILITLMTFTIIPPGSGPRAERRAWCRRAARFRGSAHWRSTGSLDNHIRIYIYIYREREIDR